ncbi:MAG: zf-TFIIB domain-containing protein [Propionicimonas sp.]
MAPSPEPYEPYRPPADPQTMTCPKCASPLRSYERNGIQIEQCLGCRGVFLDFGELEHLTQLEARFAQQPPPPASYGPAWGSHGGQKYRRGGLSGLFFSS